MADSLSPDPMDAVIAGTTPEQAASGSLHGTETIYDLRTVATLAHSFADCQPDAAFVDRLSARIRSRSQQKGTKTHPTRTISAVAATMLVFVGTYIGLGQARHAYAQGLLTKVSAMLQGDLSYQVTAVSTYASPGSPSWQWQAWYAGPGRWRVDQTGGQGLQGHPIERVSIDVGDRMTSYDSQTDTVSYNQTGTTLAYFLPLGPTANMFPKMAGCFSPHAGQGGRVDGRPAILVDSGPSHCPSIPEQIRVWVDAATNFPLKTETLSETGQLESTTTVNSIRYGASIPATVFQFQPPNGAVTYTTTGTTTVVKGPFPSAADTAGAMPGSGMITEGPFEFYATLYRDPNLRTSGTPAWLTTDVSGVGLRLLWVYEGPGQRVVWHDSWGPMDGMLDEGGNSVLQPGMRDGFDGGLLLPQNAHAGERVWNGLRISTPSGVYGVKLFYTLQKSGTGFEPVDVSVTPFA